MSETKRILEDDLKRPLGALTHWSLCSGPAAEASHDLCGEAGGHQHRAQPHLHLQHGGAGATSRVGHSDRQGASPNTRHPGALQRTGSNTHEVSINTASLLLLTSIQIPRHEQCEQRVLCKCLAGMFRSLSFTSHCLPTSTILASPVPRGRRPSTGRSSPAARRDRAPPSPSTPVMVSPQRPGGNRL